MDKNNKTQNLSRRPPKNRKSKKAAEKRAPALVENTKVAMFIRGNNTSSLITQVLNELNLLKKPHSLQFNKKNAFLPFEDPTGIEFLSFKNDASLFALGTHSKKRPHNLTLGRMYNFHLLDMIEVGVTNFQSIQDFKGEKSASGSKPCFIFQGVEFEQNEQFQKFASLLLDFFRGVTVQKINLTGLDRVIICTSQQPNKVYFRHCAIKLKKSGSKIPKIELENMGPNFDMEIRRTRFAAPDLEKEARKQPVKGRPHKIKNKSTNVYGEQKMKLHVQGQPLDEIATKKMKGLKRSRDNIEGTKQITEGPNKKLKIKE